MTKTILVVDDNELIRVLVSATLSENGFCPVAAASGAHALTLLDTTPADLLLVDFVMPGMNGAEVVQHVRAHHRAVIRRIPIVGLTASDSDCHARFLAAGADACVSKPVKDEPLLAAVRRLVDAEDGALPVARTPGVRH